MKSEFSRDKVSPGKSFTGVILQQGRVELDADFSEQTDSLRRYLMAHPEAQDTLEGISRWWLPPTAAAISPARIKAAVDALVAEGLIVEERRPGGSVYHRKRPGS
jgi:hypothetical protein